MVLVAKGVLSTLAQGNPRCYRSKVDLQLTAACAKNTKLGTEWVGYCSRERNFSCSDKERSISKLQPQNNNFWVEQMELKRKVAVAKKSKEKTKPVFDERPVP